MPTLDVDEYRSESQFFDSRERNYDAATERFMRPDRLLERFVDWRTRVSTSIISSSRRFQVWAYTAGHGQLLLRSTREPDLTTRIDVLFKNVGAIYLPTLLNGLAIAEATEAEIRESPVQLEAARMLDRKVFVVRGNNYAGYVVAGAVFWHEDELSAHDPSYFVLMPDSNVYRG